MTRPQRIRLSRTAGWRLPPNAVSVARPSRWGNPFRLGSLTTGLVRAPGPLSGQAWEFEGRIATPGRHTVTLPTGAGTVCHVRYATRVEVVELYRRALLRQNDPAIAAHFGPRGPITVTADDVRRDLAGRDVACWCPLSVPCHGDVLLQVGNSWTAGDVGAA